MIIPFAPGPSYALRQMPKQYPFEPLQKFCGFYHGTRVRDKHRFRVDFFYPYGINKANDGCNSKLTVRRKRWVRVAFTTQDDHAFEDTVTLTWEQFRFGIYQKGWMLMLQNHRSLFGMGWKLKNARVDTKHGLCLCHSHDVSNSYNESKKPHSKDCPTNAA
jgi:hypothetical protein